MLCLNKFANTNIPNVGSQLAFISLDGIIKSDTFRTVLIYGKEQESRKKYFITVQKNPSS